MNAVAVVPAERPTDSELVDSAKRGSRDAFDEIVCRHRDRLYRLAFRLTSDASDAEEVVQETFLHAYRGIRGFEGAAGVGTWLYRIAVNEALMRKRAMRRRPLQLVADLAAPPAPSSTDCEPATPADELLDQKNVATRVRSALAALEDDQRTALVLRDLEGLSAQEVSSLLGVTAEVVRQRAHRARRALREALRDLLGGTAS